MTSSFHLENKICQFYNGKGMVAMETQTRLPEMKPKMSPFEALTHAYTVYLTGTCNFSVS